MKFLSVLLRMSNSSGDFENLNACTCRWIAVRCSFMYNSWMNACVLSAKGVLAHVQLQQYNQKQECIQATSNICGCLGVLIYTCPMWAHVLGHTDTPFISSTNWKKDRIIIFQWKVYWVCPSTVCWLKAGGQWAGSCAYTWLLAGVNPPHQYFLAYCEMKEMHMWRDHLLC